MGQPQPVQQPKERRVKSFTEVSLGFPKQVTLTESRRCPQCAQPTCLDGCPLGVDIPGFIRMLREGDATGALNRIREANILPGVCGRICMAPCETACVFNDDDAAIGIRALERFAADNGRTRQALKDRASVPKNGKKVAVIGSGPSGLAAAAQLAQKGYAVTIFEGLPKPGGILRYGIPEFRLPVRVLEAEINDVIALGVEIQTNVVVGQTLSVDEIMSNYDYMFLAVGCASPKISQISGEGLIGVHYAQEVLMNVNLWQGTNPAKLPLQPLFGEKIVVIGSGHAAIDCGRIAVRLGRRASVVFPGLEEEIEAHAMERKNAIEEGLKFESLLRPLEIVATSDNHVKGVRCERLDFVEKPGQQWELKAVPGSEFLLEADTVILAQGTQPSNSIKRFLPELKWTQEGVVWVDPETAQTSVERVFATGDVISGAGHLVDALASGKFAAIAMDRYLTGAGSAEESTKI